MLLTISEAAKLLGVCENTLRDWDESSKLKAERTEGGHRRYSLEQVRGYLEENQEVREVKKEISEDDRLIIKWEDWLGEVYGEDDIRSMAVLLDNGSLYYDCACTKDCFSKDEYLWLVKESWLRTRFRKMVNVQALMGPCGMLYYMKEEKIEEQVVATKTYKYNFTIFHNAKFDNVKDLYAGTIAAELDSMMLSMLPRVNGENIRNAVKKFKLDYDYIIGPEGYIEDLRKHVQNIGLYAIPTVLDVESFMPIVAAGKYVNKWTLPIFAPYIVVNIGPRHATNVHSCLGRIARYPEEKKKNDTLSICNE